MSDENENTPENDEQLAGKIKGSARQIWLAGLFGIGAIGNECFEAEFGSFANGPHSELGRD